MFGGDGSDFEIPDFEEVRNEFQIKDTEKYQKPAQAKFSSIMDLLNGFILDGIIGNYKQAELPLMHQNLENIQELIIPEKSIFIFDRGYVRQEASLFSIEFSENRDIFNPCCVGFPPLKLLIQ